MAQALGITHDNHLAKILSYIRYAWNGKNTTIITQDEVKEWRNKLKNRATP